MHPVMDSLVAPVVFAGRDAGLEIDNSEVRSGAIKFRLRVAPDVVEFCLSRDGAANTFGELHVAACVADVRFVQRWITGIRQYLIDPTARHHIAAEEQADRLRLRQ